MSKFEEFYKQLGTEVPVLRDCNLCGDITIVNPDTYRKPKISCSIDCQFFLPLCRCKDEIMETREELEQCTYPNCSHEKVCSS
jgi:hypothetical protein